MLTELKPYLDGSQDDSFKNAAKESELYAKHVTGIDLDQELRQFVRRETETEFEQRKNHTCEINSALSNKIKNGYRKSFRASGVKEVLIGDSENEIKELIKTFTAKSTLNEVLQLLYLDSNLIDPNSFLFIDVEESNQVTERPKIKLVHILSSEVLTSEYYREKLISLTWKKGIEYNDGTEDKPDMKEGIQIHHVTDEEIILFTQISKRGRNTASYKVLTEESEFYFNGDVLFQITRRPNTLGFVPATCLGYIKNGDSFDSIISPAIQYLKKLLKRNSEYDLANHLHAFPQKAGYYPRCTEPTCHGGTHTNGGDCETCNGTGIVVPVHSSTQDFIGLPYPKKGEDVMDVSKLFMYIKVDTETLEYQQKEIQRLEEKVMESIFNNDIFSKVQVGQTATEVSQRSDNANDTLYYFMQGFARVWKFTIDTISKYNRFNLTTTELVFPNDFKLESLEQLIVNHNKAVEGNAPAFLVNQIAMDIAVKAFADSPAQLMRQKMLQRLNPFAGETTESINSKIPFASPEDVFLWANFNRVMCEVELEREDWFASPFEVVKDLVYEKVEELRGVNFNASDVQ